MSDVVNHYKHWSRGLDDKFKTEGHAPHDACTRLLQDEFVDIAIAPKFQVAKDAKFFAIGSCFARNVEFSLRDKKFDVLSLDLTLPDEVRQKVAYSPNEVMTKFTTHTMENELRCAFTDLPIDHGFIEMNPPKVWNPQLHRIGELPRELQLETALAVRNTVRKVAEADVVFLTLGLTETWWDRETETPLNDAPIDWKFAKRTGRFEFRNSNFEQNRTSLMNVINLIREHSSTRPKFIVTVSPVPLLRTFSDQDIIVANSYSKSVLRAVAEEVHRSEEDVDYFPSYEMVTYSPRHLAWRHDQRHVEPAQVWKITGKFRDLYISKD